MYILYRQKTKKDFVFPHKGGTKGCIISHSQDIYSNFLMLSSEYNNYPSQGTARQSGNTIVLCEGVFVTERQRFLFLQQNFQDSCIEKVTKETKTIYGTVGFPFADVENVLTSPHQTNFLYVLVNSVLSYPHLIYDEYIYKNFPSVCMLFKQLRQGGDIVVYKKNNRDVLFVKIHNIYEGKEHLHIPL